MRRGRVRRRGARLPWTVRPRSARACSSQLPSRASYSLSGEVVLCCRFEEGDGEVEAGAEAAGVHGCLQDRPCRGRGVVVAVRGFGSTCQVLRQAPVRDAVRLLARPVRPGAGDANLFQDRLELRAVAPLSSGDEKGEWAAATVSTQVDLAGEAALRAAQSLASCTASARRAPPWGISRPASAAARAAS